MEINLELIEKIQGDIESLATIAEEMVYDKEIVLNRIASVVGDIDQLNTIKKEYLTAYKIKTNELYEELQRQEKHLRDSLQYATRYTAWTERLENYLKKGQQPPSKFLKRGSKLELKIKTLGETNSTNITKLELMNDVLNDYNHIHFAEERKKWLWRNHLIFKLRVFIIVMLNLLISATIGFTIEKIIQFFAPKLPDFSITVIVALIGYFVFDKILERKFDRLFWKRIQKQVLIIYWQLNLYVAQIELLLRSINQNAKENTH